MVSKKLIDMTNLTGEDAVQNLECAAREEISRVYCQAETLLHNTLGEAIDRGPVCAAEKQLFETAEAAKKAIGEAAGTTVRNLACQVQNTRT